MYILNLKCQNHRPIFIIAMERVRPLRVYHVLYKPDTKHTLIKILSKVSIRQLCTRFAFLAECGLYGWIVSQSAFSFRKRPEETRRGSVGQPLPPEVVYLHHLCFPMCQAHVAQPGRRLRLLIQLCAFDLFYRYFGLYCCVVPMSRSRVL